MEIYGFKLIMIHCSPDEIFNGVNENDPSISLILMLTYSSLAVSSHVSSMAASFPSLPLTRSCLQVYLKLTYALEFMILVLMISWRGGKHTGKQKENGRSMFRYACSSKDIHKSHAASCIISLRNLHLNR